MKKMCAATVKICAATFEHITLCLRKCAAVFENISCFLRNVRLLLKDIKGNAQFISLFNPQKSGASQLCITFLQIAQKILTKDIFHWPELITKILIFLQIFSVRKPITQLL